jgi:transposase
VVLDGDGVVVSSVNVDNGEPAELVAAVLEGGEGCGVVIEAAWGWYWMTDLLSDAGFTVRLAHPLGVAGYRNRRVKNDDKDATLLADLLRMGSLPEAWIAPPELRELRELVRYRRRRSQLRSGLKAQIHAVLGKEGVIPELSELWGPAGSAWLDEQQLTAAYQDRIVSLRRLIAHYDREVTCLDRRIHGWLRDDAGYHEMQRIDGIGPVFAAIFVAEIGDVSRFKSPKQLCSWVGVTPRHRESDETVKRGPITKQGSALVRWAAIEAVARYQGGPAIQGAYRRIAVTRGNKIARVAAARRLLVLTSTTGCVTDTSAASTSRWRRQTVRAQLRLRARLSA